MGYIKRQAWAGATARLKGGKACEEPLWARLVGYTGVLMFTELRGPGRTLQSRNGWPSCQESLKSSSCWRQLLFYPPPLPNTLRYTLAVNFFWLGSLISVSPKPFKKTNYTTSTLFFPSQRLDYSSQITPSEVAPLISASPAISIDSSAQQLPLIKGH